MKLFENQTDCDSTTILKSSASSADEGLANIGYSMSYGDSGITNQFTSPNSMGVRFGPTLQHSYSPFDSKPIDIDGLSNKPITGISGFISITEKQSEILKLWDESVSIEEFRVKCDAQLSEISTDDFIVICEHSLYAMRDKKLYDKKVTLSERLFDIIENDDIFDAHVSKTEVYRHFATESYRGIGVNDACQMARSIIDACSEKANRLSGTKSQ